MAQSKTIRTAVVASALGGVLAFCGAGGCQSPSQYTSPRVTGRVLDAKSREPLKNVRVQRAPANPNADTTVDQARKAGQMMEQPSVFTTPADGTFVVESVRDLVFFHKAEWYSVKVSFECPGYYGIVTNFSVATSTQMPNGEPLVRAGDILLERTAK